MSEVRRWKLKGFIPGIEGESKAVFQPTVVLEEDYDAALAREAALREELDNHDSASQLMNAWVAEKGQMPWVTAINILAIATNMPDEERQRLIDMDDGSTERGALIAERDALQQRLTVAEQRVGDLELSAMWVRSQLTDARVIFHIDAMLKPATERPVMHPGKPPIGSVVTVHGSIKAIVIAHHTQGIIAGAGEGHLVEDGSYSHDR